MSKYVVDTHALIWFIEGNPKLGIKAKEILEDINSQLILPAIVLAEATWIIAKGKTSIPSVEDLLIAIDNDTRIVIYPLNQDIIVKSLSAEIITEMHDRLIVSTALFLEDLGEKITLLSCDININESHLVSVIW
ncbi:type II toxin-antitoxin system VapC family toxin [Geminocystis herdmanii]|jgi:PIN domain nuclease of toxin-antitoxin system|uniref:type II toxin-antitoxin system VapC family toxin n=1 Tax=Geminocystis herdmanii TaxID=669359 RepID=UPI000348AF2A|nr:PIN domain-containing protein [Geminocystis herdmanii]